MASLFATSTEGETGRLLIHKDARNTKRSTLVSKEVFHKYLRVKEISETGRQERVSISFKIFPCGSTKKRWLVLQTVLLSLSSLKQHTAFVWELSFPLLLSCHPFVLCLLYFYGKVLLNIKHNKIISRFVICDIRNNQGLVISRSRHNQITST